MGIFSSIYRYITTLGGLIEGKIDQQTDGMLTTPEGIKATFEKTRKNWIKQYGEVREAIAKLMMVMEQKKQQVAKTSEDIHMVNTKMKGAVEKFKETNDHKYQEAFNELFQTKNDLEARQDRLDGEIKELHGKVEKYKEKLQEMQDRIKKLKKQEAEAIADIVSSTQIVNLNDRLNDLSTQLEDRNLQAIEERRRTLLAEAKLSDDLGQDRSAEMEKELLNAGMNSEAADLFTAMMAEDKDKKSADSAETEKKREI